MCGRHSPGRPPLPLLSLLYNCHRLDHCSGGGISAPTLPDSTQGMSSFAPHNIAFFNTALLCFLSHNHCFASCLSHCSLHVALSTLCLSGTPLLVWRGRVWRQSSVYMCVRGSVHIKLDCVLNDWLPHFTFTSDPAPPQFWPPGPADAHF